MNDPIGSAVAENREGPGHMRATVEIDPSAHTPPFDWQALFGNAQPVEIEIGSGKGMFLKAAGRAHPEVNYLGVERAGRFYRTAAERLVRAGIPNVRLMRADGLDVLDRWVAPGSIRALHVYFPDPWPKKRHRKRRVFREAILALAGRALCPGGEVFVATDHDEYGETIRALFATAADFEAVTWPPEEAGRLPTNYALKWQRAGRRLWWGRYRRGPAQVSAALVRPRSQCYGCSSPAPAACLQEPVDGADPSKTGRGRPRQCRRPRAR